MWGGRPAHILMWRMGLVVVVAIVAVFLA